MPTLTLKVNSTEAQKYKMPHGRKRWLKAEMTLAWIIADDQLLIAPSHLVRKLTKGKGLVGYRDLHDLRLEDFGKEIKINCLTTGYNSRMNALERHITRLQRAKRLRAPCVTKEPDGTWSAPVSNGTERRRYYYKTFREAENACISDTNFVGIEHI